MKSFFPFGLPVGQEAQTDEFYLEPSTGKSFPIYLKRLVVAALGASAAVNVPHGVAAPKLDGPMVVERLVASSGALGATARTNKDSTGLSFGFTATNVVITDTTDLSAQAGWVWISYCKTTD